VSIHASLVLNVHREGALMFTTLKSLAAAAMRAKECGIEVELIAVFDRSDDATKTVYDHFVSNAFKVRRALSVDYGSLGLSRNAGIASATGEFIWTCDADDIVTSNCIHKLYETALESRSDKVVVCVEYLCAFGARYYVSRYFGSNILTAADFAAFHPYVSRIFTKREFLLQTPYRDVSLGGHYAYEDWDLANRLYAQGFEFTTAKETAFFYRQSENSLLQQANRTSVNLPPHSELFDPEIFCPLVRRDTQKFRKNRALIKERQSLSKRNFREEMCASSVLRAEMCDAAAIEPEIEPPKIETASCWCPVPENLKHWGSALAKVYEIVGSEPYTDIFLMPWLKPGGAEKVILECMEALQRTGVSQRALVLAGQPTSKHEWLGRLTRRTGFVDVCNFFPELNDDDSRAMVFRMLLGIGGKKARIHIKPCPFSHSLMSRYGAALAEKYSFVYYRFCDDVYHWNGFPLRNPWFIQFLRTNIQWLDTLITDCQNTIDRDCAIFGDEIRRKYVQVCAPVKVSTKPLSLDRPTKRLLWASRITAQKCPHLLPLVACAIRQKVPDAVIEVFGHTDKGIGDAFLYGHDGLVYRGGFDAFESIQLTNFDGLVYTSDFDGLPNVVLEAVAAGLPVIAPDVGGIREVVQNGSTGYLIASEIHPEKTAANYAEATKQLYDDWEATKKMASNAKNLIGNRHSRERLDAQMLDIFGETRKIT
jgi:glycosyltransferase involved in cell wall biosynthesis